MVTPIGYKLSAFGYCTYANAVGTERLKVTLKVKKKDGSFLTIQVDPLVSGPGTLAAPSTQTVQGDKDITQAEYDSLEISASGSLTVTAEKSP